MKYTLGLLALVVTLGFAGAEFDGGCGETFTIKGYTKAWIYMFGQENHNPGCSFRGYNWTTFQGRLNENVYAYMGTNFKTWDGNSSLHICDAYLNMNITPEISVKAGQFKIPLGWAYNCSGGGLYFLDRAAVTATTDFNNYGGRDVGAALHGQIDMVGIDVAYFNGTGSYTDADTTIKKEIAAKVTVNPAEWLTVAGGFAMIGQPEVTDTTGTVEDWSSTAFDAYVLADYPLSNTANLIFEGEFMQAGYAGPDMDNMEKTAGTAYYATLGVNIGLENAFLTSIMPAVRYESLSPATQLASSAADPEDNTTVMDFCLNCHITPKNTIQLGGRNVSYESDSMDGYTDMYLGWRVNF